MGGKEEENGSVGCVIMERREREKWGKEDEEGEEGEKEGEKKEEDLLCLEFFLLGICSSTLPQGCSGGLREGGR